MRYKIVWSFHIFGESVVDATSEKEARELANAGEDRNFEMLDPSDDWEIDKVEELPE